MPTWWLRSYIGNRGKAPTAIYSFGVEPTPALHNALAALGRDFAFTSCEAAIRNKKCQFTAKLISYDRNRMKRSLMPTITISASV
jgi:hypothetical protein